MRECDEAHPRQGSGHESACLSRNVDIPPDPQARLGLALVRSVECDEDYDVLADGIVIGRVMKAPAAPLGTPWLRTLAFGQHEDRTPTHGYEPTREDAMAAFARASGGSGGSSAVEAED